MTELYIPRYSPKSIDAYSRKVRGVCVGPAFSELLRCDAEAWNLAWLSHDYEARPEPNDSHFTTHVRRSLSMFVEERGRRHTLRRLLRLPPQAFWRAVSGDLAKRTPLYAAYGEPWLHLVMSRALSEWVPAEHSSLNVSEAARLLSKFTNAHI